MIGPKLLAAGYSDLVLIRANQKMPARKGWLENPPTPAEVEEWAGSLGVIAAETPAVDIDLHDPELADRVQALVLKHLGPAPMRLSHRPASRLLVYRTEEPYPKKVLTLPNGQGKVEILGGGRQFVVHGTHPEGTPYRWARSALWDVPSHALNRMDAEAADGLLAALQAELGGTTTLGRERDRSATPLESLRAPTPEHLTDALARIPNNDKFLMAAFPDHAEPREAWVAFAHAVYGAGGPEAEDEFVAWSATYEDGPSSTIHDIDLFRSCSDTYSGWDTIERILRDMLGSEPEDDFEFDAAEPVLLNEFPDVVPLTEEYVVDRLLPFLENEALVIAGAEHVWDGVAWRLDEMSQYELRVRAWLRDFALDLTARAGDKEAVRLAKKIQSNAGINSIRKMTQAPLSRRMSDFDKDRMALNTPVGLVDLRDGSTRPTEPTDMVTRATSVGPAERYDPKAAPNWEDFLEYLTYGDDALRQFLQRYAGYCLTGEMGEKKLVFVWGSNSNTGKSTFVNAIMHVLGDYGRGADVDAFMGNRGGSSSTDTLAQLPGVRLASATEASAGQKWDDKIIKAITGGDEIEARRMYGSYFTYHPQFKMLIAGNHQPSLKSVDIAMLKRVLIVPMNRKVENPDKQLGAKLEAEAPYILRWMIEGCLAWQDEGLNPPEAVQAATAAYVENQDTMARWFEDRCELGDDYHTSNTDLFTSWMQWNGEHRLKPAEKDSSSFRQALLTHLGERDIELETYRTKSYRGLKGIRVTHDLDIEFDGDNE